jgi:hypothetical protein
MGTSRGPRILDYHGQAGQKASIPKDRRLTAMKPLLILLVLPVIIGYASEMYFRDTRRASFAAALGSALVVFLGVFLFDPAAAWNWVAALLVSPLPIAFGVVTVLFCYGRLQMRRRDRGRGA